ncbi:MAG: PAS domain S-box protein [Oscillatoria sp. SIO1A7]|nr:PAS domain S-box protein [Oscillatoria sp. SIO1A7]
MLMEVLEQQGESQAESLAIQQLKEELLASERRFRNVFAKLGEAIAILDERGLVRFVNTAAECLFQCLGEELLGKEIFGTRVFEIKTSIYGTEKIQKMGAPNRSSMRVVQTQVEIIRPKVEKAIADMRVVETEWEGRTAFLATFIDVTERQKAVDALRVREVQLQETTQQLQVALQTLQETQSQLIQTEKMSSLGQMLAGVTHEINNPINFIYGNINHASQYMEDLLDLLHLYQKHYPNPVAEVELETEAIDLEFIEEDLPKLLFSMKLGTDRIRQIVLSLRNFSRLDEAEMKKVDIHQGIDSTLEILQSRLKGKGGAADIEIVKEYGQLSRIECYASQLNQVFMNILANAIDALEESIVSGQWVSSGSALEKGELLGDRGLGSSPETATEAAMIRIRTFCDGEYATVRIADNGAGMKEEVRQRVFDPFFTTKTVGKGTGLGLSISYQIVVDKHGGQLQCYSVPGLGTEFVIEIPMKQKKAKGRVVPLSSQEDWPQPHVPKCPRLMKIC